MKKLIIGILVIGALGFGSNATNQGEIQGTNLKSSSPQQSESLTTKQKIVNSTCDGINITTNCVLDGVKYASYIYHPAVPEKSHDETVTTYREEVSGYCTLCNDGTYSPSCATGRGACSHHGGVAEWNSPVQRSVPQYSTKKIIDAAAQEAYYQKVPQ